MGNSLQLYDSAGWLDIRGIVDNLRKQGISFIFCVSARGTGKTYTALKWAREEYKGRTLYVRRTAAELDMAMSDAGNPYNKLNEDMGLSVRAEKVGKSLGRLTEDGEEVAVAASLKDVAKMRGFDMSYVDLVLYDEFIPEQHVVRFKGEGAALQNLAETVGRNRELAGKPPLLVLCLGNSNQLDNPLFRDLRLSQMAATMQRKGKEYSINKDRCVAIIMPRKSPVSQAKEATALYKFSAGTGYSDMALHNNYADYSERCVRPMRLNQLQPVVAVRELAIYRIKGERDYYVSMHKSGTAEQYGDTKAELMSFRRQYVALIDMYLSGHVWFEDFVCKARYEEYIGLNG